MNPPTDIFFDLPWWLDTAITIIWFAMSIINGILITRVGSTLERWLLLFGWSILCVTWTYRLIAFGNVTVSVPSIVAVLLIAAALVIGARRQLQEWSADVRCFKDHNIKCHRSDRIEFQLKRRDK